MSKWMVVLMVILLVLAVGCNDAGQGVVTPGVNSDVLGESGNSPQDAIDTPMPDTPIAPANSTPPGSVPLTPGTPNAAPSQ
jgi:hypothetical protein